MKNRWMWLNVLALPCCLVGWILSVWVVGDLSSAILNALGFSLNAWFLVTELLRDDEWIIETEEDE